MDEQKVTVGRIVHFVMPDGKTHRPAIVTHDWGGCVQLQVFLDGTNEECYRKEYGEFCPSKAEQERGIAWRTSVHQDETEKGDRTWHWPERE
jgi:hypothetical protein